MGDLRSIHDLEGLSGTCRDAHRFRRFRIAAFKKFQPVEICLESAPELAPVLDAPSLVLIDRKESRQDGAVKLLFETRDGHRIESVLLRIASGRSSLCVSSQIGCAGGCAFCATGRSGWVRNLSTQEMLDQVLLAGRLLRGEGRTLRNVVFMGMGEPLHNTDALFATLDALRDPQRFALSDAHLMVSTAGVPAAMEALSSRFPRVRLALSLHSARQEVRERLMPLARSVPLDQLRVALPPPGTPWMAEVVLLRGINDGLAERDALISFLHGTDAHINLLQFNPWPGAPFEAVDLEAREAFGAALRSAGFKVTLRYSLGRDIAAACGQLAGEHAKAVEPVIRIECDRPPVMYN